MTAGNPGSGQEGVPAPVDGKFIFQIGPGIRVRFNADGWVEEIGKGGAEDPLGTKLQGKPGSGLDDILARRYYDLYARLLIVDIHPQRSADFSGTGGVVPFRDIEPGSPLYERIGTIIAIANHYFDMKLKPLSG